MSLFKHGKGPIQISERGNSPKVTPLPLGRLRVERRFDLHEKEEVSHRDYNTTRPEDLTIRVFGGFGLLDGTDLEELPELPTGDEWSKSTKEFAYKDCRLIDEDCDPGQDNKWILAQTYETLTKEWALQDLDQHAVSENGIDIIKRTQIARRGVSLPYSDSDVGHATLDNASRRVLSGINDKSSDRFGLVETIWAMPAIINVRTFRVGGQQRVQVSAIGLPEESISNALGEVTKKHKLIDESTGNWDGYQTKELIYEVEDFIVLVATEGDLTVVRKTELSESPFTKAIINDTTVTYGGQQFVLRQEEIDNDGIIKKRVQNFALYEEASFPAQTLYEIDRRYGIAVPVVRQVVPFGETGEITDAHAKQVEPVDAFRALKYTILAADVPAAQVWYERRNVNIFPIELKSVSIVGVESPTAVINYTEPPRSGIKVKVTRKYHWGPPPTPEEPTQFWPQSFSGAVEVLADRNSTSVSQSTGITASSGTSTNNSTSTSQNTNSTNSSTTANGTSNSTINSTNSGTGNNTSQTTSQGTNQTTSSNTYSSQGAGQNTSNSTTASTNSGNSTSFSSSNYSANNSSNVSSWSSNNSNVASNSTSNSTVNSNSTSNNTSSVTSNSNSTSNSTSQGNSSNTTNSNVQSDVENDSSSEQRTQASINSVISAASPERNSESTGKSSNNSTTITDATSTSTFTSSGSNTNSTTGSSNSTSNNSSNGTSTSNATNNGTSNSTSSNNGNSNSWSNSSGDSSNNASGSNTSSNNGTSNSTSSTTSTNSGSSQNTGNSTSNGSGNSTSNTTSQSTNQGSSQGTSQTTSNSSTDSSSNNTSATQSTNDGTSNRTSEGTTTTVTTSSGARIVAISMRPCLRPETTVTINGTDVVVPATSPTALPWGTYTEFSRKASHWRYNIWVEEIEEAYLPAVVA